MSLIELCIALVVLAIGILAVGRLFPAGARAQAQDRLLISANYYAQEKVESLTGLSWADAALTDGRHPAGTGVRHPRHRSLVALLPGRDDDRIPRQPEEGGRHGELLRRRPGAAVADGDHLREAVNSMRAYPRSWSLGRRASAGFTLVEMMVTLVIFAMVAVTVTLVLMSSAKSKQRTTQRIESEQGARAAVDLIARDIRTAGYGADLDDSPPQPAIAYVDSKEILLSENQTPYPDPRAGLAAGLQPGRQSEASSAQRHRVDAADAVHHRRRAHPLHARREQRRRRGRQRHRVRAGRRRGGDPEPERLRARAPGLRRQHGRHARQQRRHHGARGARAPAGRCRRAVDVHRVHEGLEHAVRLGQRSGAGGPAPGHPARRAEGHGHGVTARQPRPVRADHDRDAGERGPQRARLRGDDVHRVGLRLQRPEHGPSDERLGRRHPERDGASRLECVLLEWHRLLPIPRPGRKLHAQAHAGDGLRVILRAGHIQPHGLECRVDAVVCRHRADGRQRDHQRVR